MEKKGTALKHWEHRPEPGWKHFSFNQPYAKGLKRLNDEVLAKTDFDPATLWQWGTMQAMAVIEILKDCEKQFGAEGQQVVCRALERIGLDVGRQILRDMEKPESMTEEELVSFFATVVNRIAYASLEDPKIDGPGKVSFDILWCPHQDHYQAFDCRVQRYLVQGMVNALQESGLAPGFQVRFDTTIPTGAPTCHFTVWKASTEEGQAWKEYSRQLEHKALHIAAKEKAEK
jgi:hypothetical protein